MSLLTDVTRSAFTCTLGVASSFTPSRSRSARTTSWASADNDTKPTIRARWPGELCSMSSHAGSPPARNRRHPLTPHPRTPTQSVAAQSTPTKPTATTASPTPTPQPNLATHLCPRPDAPPTTPAPNSHGKARTTPHDSSDHLQPPTHGPLGNAHHNTSPPKPTNPGTPHNPRRARPPSKPWPHTAPQLEHHSSPRPSAITFTITSPSDYCSRALENACAVGEAEL